jgi:hypothetical protein
MATERGLHKRKTEKDNRKSNNFFAWTINIKPYLLYRSKPDSYKLSLVFMYH